MKRLALGAMATWTLLCLFFIPNAAAQQIGVDVRQDGQAAPGVSVVFVAANVIKAQTTPADNANKDALNIGNVLKTRTAITDSNGNSVLDLSNIIKSHEKIEVQIVVRKCENGKNVVYVVQKGAQVPPQDEKCVNNDKCKCNDYVAGIYIVSDGDTVTVNITPGAVNVQIAQGTGTSGISHKPQTHVPVWVQVDGGPGFKNFSGLSGNCSAFTQIFPGGKCDHSSNSFAFDVGGSLHVWHAAVRGGYFRANNIQLNGTGTVPGGTDTLRSTLQPDGGYLTGGFCVPIGNKLSFIPEGGAAFWRVNLKRTETVTTGSTTNTSTDSGQVTGTGPMVGAALHLDLTSVVGVEVRYDWVQMSNTPLVNEHNNLLLINLTIRWPRK
jgi:hypothetical protein